MQVLDLVADAQAASADDGLAGVKTWLEGLADRIDEVSAALDFLPGRGPNPNQAFYRSPGLTMLKVRFPVGRRTPPHDHGTWAAILLLAGRERNTLYRTDGGLAFASEVTLEPGPVLPLRAEAAHVAECASDEAAFGLHVYGGDIVTLPRTMWHPETLQPGRMEDARYEQLAQIASAADGAPRP